MVNGSPCEAYEYDLTTNSGKKLMQKTKNEGLLGLVHPEINKNLAVHCRGKDNGTKAAYNVLNSM